MAVPLDNLVVGLGATGLSVARHLAARGESFAVADSRADPPGLERLKAECVPLEIHLGAFDRSLFHRARRLIVSPGVAVSSPAILEAQAAGAEVLGDIELFARCAHAPVIAITGSNGKSTVTTLVGEMARRAGLNVVMGGNLGTPALDLLAEPEPDLYVLELSSFQLETTHSLRPRAAVVLNVSPDHLDRYESIAAYAQAKARVYAGAGHCVVNRDDPLAASLVGECATTGFGLGEPLLPGDYGLSCVDGIHWLMRGQRPLLAANTLRMAGRHNLANALAALALGDEAGLPLTAMLAALRDFPGLPHRCQWVGQYGGADWYNDSKGTNVGATLAAIEGLDGPLVLIAGGQAKGQDFTSLRAALSERARGVVLIGIDAARLREALSDAVPLVEAADMEAAVRAAADFAQAGDRVLLSPACASLDMYANYAARGDSFVRAFEALSHD
ncbi:UDP-N-acetylmuramoylalanine--D-glutamate ligase [Acidihalobacter yilgarnensis]|uniref:UDP-N-acetylmuramoylalanine--D-glutamate ligase n=1 Tax=Acidihalobacter yilgarnensis TaxID=2819280 RepID=A0A1D8ITH1_9GAMM|nr:UDP-N-acetylmuramoyl-L-alanine--D-glutamate ligase [Acidihalobacter yilgarnensis]AOU99766.1 UDP-N-acetylmuramoylalanine--D-glutamate ligase [Acidihalobacter yilgarnensis]